MYYWKIDKLADEFRQSTITEEEEFRYLLAWIGLNSLAVVIPSITGGPSHVSALTYGYLFSLAGVTTLLIGSFLCCRANVKGDNRDFIARFVCLLWPAGFRVLLFAIPVIFLAFAVGLQFPPEDRIAAFSYFNGAIGVAGLIVQLTMVRRMISMVARHTESARHAVRL